MTLADFQITRYQFRGDRPIGDSQVRSEVVHVAALELIDDAGRSGLAFIQSLFVTLPSQTELERLFAAEWWPALQGRPAAGLVHKVGKPRGGRNRPAMLPAGEAVQVALWDLFGKQMDMPLWRLLGGEEDRASVPCYASGLDFHLDDDAFCELFGTADALGYSAFKIKVGHADFDRDLHRLDLLRRSVRKGATVMIDANEAWGAKEALMKI
ncbi:L-Ala-D/L-Glu epimerase [Roseisalinus antarcticus]|uniref:L-Ala-D/L-Glu epimerase n=1 Tax=Roseisalinus antarcticus TaxID=254357 RepID=A0A1Y5T9T6_9RHOB|nr:L-Ala-D/L-Glu epimerase [Roseisalinus antarcticus]